MENISVNPFQTMETNDIKNENFIPIEKNYIQNIIEKNIEKKEITSIKQKKTFQLMKKLSNQSYQQSHKLPSVRKMIQTISHVDSSNYPNQIVNNNKTLLSSPFSSNKSLYSNKSNRNKRLNNISKLISLQNSHLNKVKLHEQSSQVVNQMHSNIYSLIDQIYNVKNNDKAFFSQPHSLSERQHKKNKKIQQQNQNTKGKARIQYVSIPRSNRILQHPNVQQQKSSPTKSIDTKRTLDSFINTIIPEKINQNMSASKFFKDQKQKKSPQKYQRKEIIKKRNIKWMDVQSPQIVSDRHQYKRKGKQYFHIQINKSQGYKRLETKEIDEILPQIKVNVKSRHHKIK